MSLIKLFPLWGPLKSKKAAIRFQMADMVWKGVYPQVFGHSDQLLHNRFFIWILLYEKIRQWRKKWPHRGMAERNLETSSIHVFFIKFCLPKKIVFHQMSSFIKGCPPSIVVFHQRLSSIRGCLPSKVVFHQRSSSVSLYQKCSTMFLNVPILLTTLQTSL